MEASVEKEGCAVVQTWAGAAAGAAAVSVPPDTFAKVTQQLQDSDFEDVAATLTMYIDVRRDPLAINWCTKYGFRHGHVLPLYMLVRNVLKWSKGSVPSTRELELSLQNALILLIRVAQDVTSCRRDLAKRDLEFIYSAFRDKLHLWMASWGHITLPPVSQIMDKVDKWFAHTPLPLPTWATCFQKSWPIGDTFYWNTPTKDDISAFSRCQTVDKTRASVYTAFKTRIESFDKWNDVFSIDKTIMDSCE